MDNHKSAQDKGANDVVEKHICEGMTEGHYCVCRQKPKIVSAIGAVPTQVEGPMGNTRSTDFRVIHDCSLPKGKAVNDYVNSLDTFCYDSLDNVVRAVGPNFYLAKLDLKRAYHSVPLHPSNYPLTGLKWNFKGQNDFTYICDTKLPFGAKIKSPFIFNCIT